MPLLFLLAGIIVLAFIVIRSNLRRFNDMVDAEIDALLDGLPRADVDTIQEADFAAVPEVVASYLKRCVRVGQPYPYSVRLKQTGQMRLAPNQAWKPFTAQQYFVPGRTAFLWRAWVRFMPFVTVTARDKFVDGHGTMLIRILATVTVADASGPKLDSAALIRYVSEMIWFPAAMLKADYLQWKTADAQSATVTATVGASTVDLTFHFDASGDIVKMTADRFKDTKDPAPTPWIIAIHEYATHMGVRVPADCDVTWDLPEGPFTWLRLKIKSLEVNAPFRY